MDPWKLSANTEFSYPHSFRPDYYNQGYSFTPINPQAQFNWNLPIPEFNINRYDVMSQTSKHSGPKQSMTSNTTRKRNRKQTVS